METMEEVKKGFNNLLFDDLIFGSHSDEEARPAYVFARIINNIATNYPKLLEELVNLIRTFKLDYKWLIEDHYMDLKKHCIEKAQYLNIFILNTYNKFIAFLY